MSTQQNKALARRLYDEAWNKGNVDVVDELVASNCVSHETDNPMIPADEGGGLEGIKRGSINLRAAFPDVQLAIEDQIAGGDKVLTRFTATATHTGPLGRIPPTGKRATITGM